MLSSQDRIYSSTDYHEHKHGASLKTSDLITRYRTQKFRAFIGSSNLDLLEVGIGPGWNLVRLPAHRRVGQDVTLAYAELLRNQGVEFVSDLAQLSGQQFDIVILSHVLEHLLEPANMLVEVRALLKPGARLLLIVPLESPLRTFSPKDKNHHLFSWNVQSLNEFLTACNYSVRSCEVKRYGFDLFTAKLAVRLGGGYGLYRLLLSLLQTIQPSYEIQVIAECNALFAPHSSEFYCGL
jgi:SAM-dependent methyltransferase